MSTPAFDPARLASSLGITTTGDEWHLRAAVRAAFRRSLYVTVKIGVCWGEPRNLMDADTFKPSCDWLQAVVTTTKRGLFEDPRGHIKTTRATRGIPHWYAIQRPHDEHDHPAEIDRANTFLDAHPHIKGVDGRLIIASDSRERATRWVGSTQTDWEANPVMRWAFPELLWPNYNRLPYGEWTAHSYVLNGRRNTAEPNPYLTSLGLESRAQGGRADGIIVDDLVGETSYRSPMEIERRRDWLRTIGFLLENRSPSTPDGGFILVVGNRWTLDDVNSMIHTDYLSWSIWRRSALRCLVHGVGNCGRWGTDEANACAPADATLWKQRYPTVADLMSIVEEASEDVVAAQLYNDPSRTADFDASRFGDFAIATDNVTVDGTLSREWCAVVERAANAPPTAPARELIPLAALSHHLISVDVASSKEPRAARTALSWLAFDRATNRVFWLDCRADRWAPEEAVAQALALWSEAAQRSRSTPRILVERVAAQAYFATALANQGRLAGVRLPPIELISPRGVPKEDRIRQRVGYRLNQGQLMLRAGLQLPRAEARRFPTGTCDALDTAAQAEEVFLALDASRSSSAAAAERRRMRRARAAAAGRAGVLP